jgi:hypothetical protein
MWVFEEVVMKYIMGVFLLWSLLFKPAFAVTILSDLENGNVSPWEIYHPSAVKVESGPLSIDGNYLRLNGPGVETFDSASNIQAYFDDIVAAKGMQLAFDMYVVADYGKNVYVSPDYGVTDFENFGVVRLGFFEHFSADFVQSPVQTGVWNTYSTPLEAAYWTADANNLPDTRFEDVVQGVFMNIDIGRDLFVPPLPLPPFADVLIDNVRIEPVPLPVGAVLLFSAFGALIGMRRVRI